MSLDQNLGRTKSTSSSGTRRAGSLSDPARMEARTPRDGQETQLLECNSCGLRIYDAWKGVRCDHVICTDCMVRTSQELIHCQICITLCIREGHHIVCIVCFGCDLLCRCPERLQIAPPSVFDTADKKSNEFYQRISSEPSVVVKGYSFQQPVSNEGGQNIIYKRELKRDRHVVEEDVIENNFGDEIKKLFTRVQKFEQRLKILEDNYQKMQSRIHSMGSLPHPQALFSSQYGVEPGAVDGLQSPAYDQHAERFPNPDATSPQQQHQLYYGQHQMPGGTPLPEMEQQPGVEGLSQQPQLLETIHRQFNQQPSSYFPVDAEGFPQQPRAIMAVIQVRSSCNSDPVRFNPENVPYTGLQEGADIIVENSGKVREIPQDVDASRGSVNEDDGKAVEDKYAHAAGERRTENNSSLRDSNLIWNAQDLPPDGIPKRDVETSAQLGNVVMQLANLYDKVNFLEADNAKLRDDQVSLKKANIKMRDKVNSLRFGQSRAQVLSLHQLRAQAEPDQGQKTTKINAGRAGTSTTTLQICIEAIVDRGSSDNSSSTKAPIEGDVQAKGQGTRKRGDAKAKVKSDVNLETRSGTNKQVHVAQRPTTVLGYVQVPQPVLNKAAISEKTKRRTSSLPTQPFDNPACTESDLETYKRRMDDMTDWYRSCRRRDMFLEQTTWSYLRRQLTNRCHFLDFLSAFYWEVDKCSKLHVGKESVRDFRIFGGPIIDLACKGLFRFVVDPNPSNVAVYVEILISAKPKRDHRYHLKVGSVRSGEPFHERQYTGEEMFGFKGVLSYPGTPCLGFFSIVINVDSRALNKDETLSDTLIIELAKVHAS